MAGSAGLEKVREFRLRPIDKPEELRAAEGLERQAMGGGDEVPVSVSVLRAAQEHGGLVFGAFADIYLAGVGADLLGWDGTELYRYALLTAVLPEYQHHQLAYRLMLFRRESALQQGLPAIRWTFDPLRRRAARLSIRRLGARPEKYLPHHLGRLAWTEEAGLDTDRLRVRWPIAEPAIETRLAAPPAASEDDRALWEPARPILTTEPGEHGLRAPVAVEEPVGPSAHLEIPFDLAAVREHEPEALPRWRYAVRDGFRAAQDLGYEVTDFLAFAVEHERRCFYLLRPVSKAPAPSPAAAEAP
ncbi:MAG TPA: hypothetical protein VGU43_04675 [Thermoplasmata archaeon]|nr:hypothetical protein [Thermoplasmata archaeon]